MFLIWPLIVFFAFRSERLRARPFIVLLAVSVLGTALYDYVTVSDVAAAVEDQSFRWHPLMFAADVIVTWLLYAATFVVAHRIGRWWRERRQ